MRAAPRLCRGEGPRARARKEGAGFAGYSAGAVAGIGSAGALPVAMVDERLATSMAVRV